MHPANILLSAVVFAALATPLGVATATADQASQLLASSYHGRLCSAGPEDAVKVVYAWHGFQNAADFWKAAYATKPLPPDLQLVAIADELAEESYRRTVVLRAAEQAKQLKATLEENNRVLLNQQQSYERAKEMGVAVQEHAPEPYPECACSSGGSLLESDATLGDALLRMLSGAYTKKFDEVCNGLARDATVPAKEVPDAEAVLHAEPPTVHENGSYTTADGKINTKGTVGYSGEYTWLKPPTNIGKEGFTIWVRSVAKSDKGQRFDTGIAVKGGEFITESQTPEGVKQASGQIEVKTFSDNGKTADTTVWIKVMPPTNVVKGQKYYLEIGAFYGPNVTYTYIGK